jgi:cytochrome P450
VTAATHSTLDDEFLEFLHVQPADPRPFYARLREQAPVYRTPLGYWFVSSYAEAFLLWRHDEWFSRRPVSGGARNPLREQGGRTAAFFEEVILAKDGPDHQRIRGLVDDVFGPRSIGQLRATVEETVDELLNAALSSGTRSMDLVSAFARPLPTKVILRICGMDDRYYDHFVEVADTVIECFASTGAGHVAEDLPERAERVFGECAELLLSLANERRGSGGSDLFTTLVRVQDAEPDRFTRSELVTMMMFLVTAGFETTMHTAANGVYHLLRDRAQWQLLQADLSLVRSAATEILRYEPGVAVSSMMYATADIPVAGVVIPRGAGVLISNHAANHDPNRVPDPLRFDITRPGTGQLSFGRGRHTCLGAHLARLELEVALERLVTRVPDLQLVNCEPVWQPSHVLRGFDSLAVSWLARGLTS